MSVAILTTGLHQDILGPREVEQQYISPPRLVLQEKCIEQQILWLLRSTILFIKLFPILCLAPSLNLLSHGSSQMKYLWDPYGSIIG